jgi:hypothetical protein
MVSPLTQISCIKTLETLPKPFRIVRPYRKFAEIVFQHDNARQNPLKTQEAITRLEWGVIPLRPCVPDVASCDLHFLETLKTDIRGVAGHSEL